ncbi:putative major pilin subunit [Prochlorococcus marinus str. MIT 1318]|uniref:prepilin-type N-terminal cleavage/methylation domain-containing protein n=1 Tax=Prochlorococcus TaxID=1218 RepID=UPI0007B3D924|nr:prepilin-type N-terminal cleavage/methylation domain-containing protein [Prochlorococcus marinus]KZR71020.1 putative major pilin subunit [Prochlorococcus marinus str. MIT 1318]
MTALQSYLASSKIQKVLNRRPGEEGFSLIELVVVVAVLAILAAVAIPNFTSLTDDARLNTAKETLASMYKECEYNKARKGEGSHKKVSVDKDEVINGVQFSGTNDEKCEAAAGATITVGANTCYIELLLGGDASGDAAKKSGKSKDSTATGWKKTFEECSA